MNEFYFLSQANFMSDIEDKDKKTKSIVLVKSNTLINARLSQKYTLNEQKLILWILSNVTEKHAVQNEELELDVIDFANLINSPRENIYREAKTIATKLLSKTLLLEDEDEKGFVACNWFSGMRYRSGRFYIRVYDGLIPHLINLKKCFTSYKLSYALTLQSSYAIRLYELLSQYIKIKNRTFDIDVLRQNLGILNGELKQFGHFKERVLDISEREINAKTDIRIAWEAIRKGRKVTHIKFLIESTEIQNHSPNQEKDITHFVSEDVSKRLLALGITENKVKELLHHYSAEYLIEKLTYVQAKISSGKIPKSPAGFFIKSVEEDYKPLTEKEKIDTHKIIKKVKNNKNSEKLKLEQELESAKQGLESVPAKYSEQLKEDFEKQVKLLSEKLKNLEEVEN